MAKKRTGFGLRLLVMGAMCNPGDMHSGTVRNWFDSSHAKGYGFIIPDIDGEDVFVHRQNVMNATYLATGDTVTYMLSKRIRTSCKRSRFG